MKTFRIVITGRVQGVYFRASAKEVADQLRIKGTVRNLTDRNVEIISTGNEDQVNKLVDWCRQGPPSAQVKEVLKEELPLKEFSDFRISR